MATQFLRSRERRRGKRKHDQVDRGKDCVVFPHINTQISNRSWRLTARLVDKWDFVKSAALGEYQETKNTLRNLHLKVGVL